MRRACFASLILLALAPAAAAQAAKPDPATLLKAAYILRRQGKYKQACAAFETLLRALKKSPWKKPIALETAELYKVMGDERKALLLYRRNNDVKRELETLLAWKGANAARRHKEALTVARLVKQPWAEVRALAKLGNTAEAIKIAQANNLTREHADLLMAEKRYEEAAALYFKASMFFEQAEALEAAAKVKEAKRAYEDAAETIKYRLKEKSIPNFKSAKRAFEAATKKGSVNRREKARYDMVRRYGALREDYRRWAKCLSATTSHPRRAIKAVKIALSHARKQQSLLEDKAGGGDVYGKAAAQTLFELPKQISALQLTLQSYQAALPKQGK